MIHDIDKFLKLNTPTAHQIQAQKCANKTITNINLHNLNTIINSRANNWRSKLSNKCNIFTNRNSFITRKIRKIRNAFTAVPTRNDPSESKNSNGNEVTKSMKNQPYKYLNKKTTRKT